MLTGVEILLERMKTNPEEFIEGGYSKWSSVMSSGWDIFTEEERTAVQEALIQAKRDHFNGEVMRVLTGHVDSITYQEVMRLDSSGNLSVGTSPSILTPDALHKQVKDALEKQFDEAYARKDKQVMKTATKLKDAMRK
jgi:hypothetical protein